MGVKDALLARHPGTSRRWWTVAHVDDSPGCRCHDCCQVRFQCWRVAIESGRAVIWVEGRWMIASDDLDEWDDDRAA